MPSDAIGFIGLGNMGSVFAGRLLDAGRQLVVFDVRDDAMAPLVARGAAGAASVREVADRAETVLVSLPTPPVVRAVAIGESGIVDGGKVRAYIDLSTSGPRTASEVAAALRERGIVSLDAPVSGGVGGARKGTLAVMVSGPRTAFDTFEPLLKTFGRLFYIGERPGSAQMMKLANNLVAATTLAVTCEAVALGERAGLDPVKMVEILNASSGRSSASEEKFPRAILPRTFDFGFSTGLSFKDVRLCLEEAEALGMSVMVGRAARQMLEITAALYGADSDFTMMMRTVEHLSGLDRQAAGSASSRATTPSSPAPAAG
jgi:3-hydroxyisobutyrate dehydrogenase-like beta-hydroxyacid dehydrogenase